MLLETYCSGLAETNSVLLSCEQTQKGVLIDAPPQSGRYWLNRINALELTVEMLLLTHSHWDHTADMAFLKKELKAPLFVHELDAPNLRNPGADGLPLLMEIEPVEPDQFLEEGQRLTVGRLTLEVIHTPGHSPGGVCFYLPDEKTLISGDTLFQGTIGNLSFPCSDPEKMWSSLEKLSKLPSDTRVIPGHGNETRIEDERKLLLHAKEYFGG